MANRDSRIVIPVRAPSFDGRFYGRYPNGDKPVSGAALNADAQGRVNVDASMSAAIKMAANAGDVVSTAAGLSTAVRLAGTANVRVAAQGALPGGGPIFAANRPAGLTTILDRQWNTAQSAFYTNLAGVDPYNMMWFGDVSPICDTPANLGAIIGEAIPALPDGNPTALAIKYPNGFTQGFTPFGASYQGALSVKEYYQATWVYMPAQFDPNSNNMKWVFHQQSGSCNHVLMLSSGSQGVDMMGPWMALQGGGNGSANVGGAGNTKAGAVYRNAPPVSNRDGCWDFRRSGWHCIEHRCKQETALGAGNGIYQSWFDGTLINDFRNLNYNASGDAFAFDSILFTPYYGGGGSAATADRYLVIGRFLVAGGNS